MNFTVRELSKARADKRDILEWLLNRSRTGARAWLSAYDNAVERLKTTANSCGEADENSELDTDVKQALFKTRRGRTYRILFLIESSQVYILRVRGPGQAPVDETDVEPS